MPPVYLSVQPLRIQLLMSSLYCTFSEADLRLPGLKMLVFSLITQCSWERIHWPSIWVSYCTLSTSGLQRMTVVRGPQMAKTAFTWVFNFLPISLSSSCGQTEKILPTEKLVSTIELPSRGSQVTSYPPFPLDSSIYSGLSSLAMPRTMPQVARCFSTISSHSTSRCSCWSPNLLTLSKTITGVCCRTTVISRIASSRDSITGEYSHRILKVFVLSIFRLRLVCWVFIIVFSEGQLVYILVVEWLLLSQYFYLQPGLYFFHFASQFAQLFVDLHPFLYLLPFLMRFGQLALNYIGEKCKKESFLRNIDGYWEWTPGKWRSSGWLLGTLEEWARGVWIKSDKLVNQLRIEGSQNITGCQLQPQKTAKTTNKAHYIGKFRPAELINCLAKFESIPAQNDPNASIQQPIIMSKKSTNNKKQREGEISTMGIFLQ